MPDAPTGKNPAGQSSAGLTIPTSNPTAGTATQRRQTAKRGASPRRNHRRTPPTSIHRPHIDRLERPRRHAYLLLKLLADAQIRLIPHTRALISRGQHVRGHSALATNHDNAGRGHPSKTGRGVFVFLIAQVPVRIASFDEGHNAFTSVVTRVRNVRHRAIKRWLIRVQHLLVQMPR
jgi:hypothetical protein